jgi:SAM-dependent methyltransferase
VTRIAENLNRAARDAGVAASVAQFENVGTHAQYRVPYAIASAAIRAGDRVLDWGCGNGHFSFFLQSLGATITGYSYEPFPACMAGSPSFAFVSGIDGDARTLPFAAGSFDVVVGVGVLEHVSELGGDERASLGELARVLVPGGTLLTFHLPNETGWVEGTIRALRLNRHHHQRRFEAGEIRRLWGEAGFTVSRIGRYNALPRNELRSLPGPVRTSRAFIRAYDLLDGTIARVAPRVCTNWYVVAHKAR